MSQQFSGPVTITGAGNQVLELTSTDPAASVTRLMAVTSNNRTESQLQFKSRLLLVAPLGGTPIVNVGEDGKVGIGTTFPSVKTQIEGTDDQGATLAIRRSDNNKFMRLGVGGQGVALDFDPTSFLVIQKNTLGIDGVLAGQELLRVTADGNVGIGTAAPTAKAEIRVANEGDSALKLQSGPNDFFDVRPTNVGGRFQTELNTANNRDLVILPGTGNVLIGTTVPSTSARLTVEAVGPDSGDFTFAAGVVGRATNPTGVPGLFRQTAGVRGINDDGHGVQGQI
jgi:hypothetical protein